MLLPSPSLLLAGGFAAAAFLLQIRFIVAAGDRLGGDEAEYLARARREGLYRGDRFAPEPFLRLPLMAIWVAAWDRGGSAGRVRWAMSLVSAVAVGAAVLLGTGLGGAGLALGTGIVLLLVPERAFLASCLWPDTWLSLSLLGVLGVLVHAWNHEPDVAHAVLLGVALTVAAGLRIDGVALGISALVAAFCLSWPASDLLVAGVLPLASLLLWTARSWRRYQLPFPETTFAFNLAIADRESAAGGFASIQQSVLDVFHGGGGGWVASTWERRLEVARSSLGNLASHPLAALVQMARRLFSLLGPDTFVSELLLRDTALYGAIRGQERRVAKGALRWCVPCAFGLTLAAAVARFVASQSWAGFPPLPQAVVFPHPAFWIPVLGQLFVTAAVHTRTRYRLVLLPVLALLVAEAAKTLASLARVGGYSLLGVVMALAVAVMLALAHRPVRREIG